MEEPPNSGSISFPFLQMKLDEKKSTRRVLISCRTFVVTASFTITYLLPFAFPNQGVLVTLSK